VAEVVQPVDNRDSGKNGDNKEQERPRHREHTRLIGKNWDANLLRDRTGNRGKHVIGIRTD